MKFKKILITCITFLLVIPISGCTGMQDFVYEEVPSFFGSEIPRINQVLVQEHSINGWFERNPIPIYLASEFPQKDIDNMLSAIDYLNNQSAGLILEPIITGQDWFKYRTFDMDTGDFIGTIEHRIYVYKDIEREYTGNTALGVAKRGMDFGGTTAKKGIEGAVPYKKTYKIEEISFDDEVISWEDAKVYKRPGRELRLDYGVTAAEYFDIRNIDYEDEIYIERGWYEYSFYGGDVYLRPDHHKSITTQHLFLHEVLHILGFGHIDDPNAIMYYSAGNWPFGFTTEEKRMLRELYQPGIPDHSTVIHKAY